MGRSTKSIVKARKRVEAESESSIAASSLVRGKDGSAFAKCDECKKDVPVALIFMHSCSLDAKIKMNLEAQVIEGASEVKKKQPESKKKTNATNEPKAKKAKLDKKDKDPNMPKRPPTSFFIFLDEFRKTFKEANPDSKGVKEVAKEGGEKWKSMTDEEKKPYLDKAIELKAEYEKAIKKYKSADANADDENADAEHVSDKEVEQKSDAEHVSDKEVEQKSDAAHVSDKEVEQKSDAEHVSDKEVEQKSDAELVSDKEVEQKSDNEQED